jgi:hypothetical protein
MTNPITPPPELVQQWASEWMRSEAAWEAAWPVCRDNFIATRAAQWGADTELEACCEWADETGWQGAGDGLRTTRRLKPPSLKEQAIRELGGAYDRDKIDDTTYDTIRRALEALPDD